MTKKEKEAFKAIYNEDVYKRQLLQSCRFLCCILFYNQLVLFYSYALFSRPRNNAQILGLDFVRYVNILGLENMLYFSYKVSISNGSGKRKGKIKNDKEGKGSF